MFDLFAIVYTTLLSNVVKLNQLSKDLCGEYMLTELICAIGLAQAQFRTNTVPKDEQLQVATDLLDQLRSVNVVKSITEAELIEVAADCAAHHCGLLRIWSDPNSSADSRIARLGFTAGQVLSVQTDLGNLEYMIHPPKPVEPEPSAFDKALARRKRELARAGRLAI